MLKRMFNTSKRLFFSAFAKAIMSGIFPTVELVLSRNLISCLTMLDWNGSISYIIAIIGSALIYNISLKLLDLIEGNSYTLIKQNMWFDLFEKTSTLDLALADHPDNRTLYEEARGATQNNRCINIVDSFFNIVKRLITLSSIIVVTITVDPYIFIVVAIVVLIQTILTIKSQKRQYETWKEDSRTNKEVSYIMGLLFDRNCANEFRLHNLSKWVINKYKIARKKSDEYWEKNRKRQISFSAISFIANLIQKFVLYIYLAVQMIFYGMSIANFTLCFSSLNQLSSTLTALITDVLGIGENARYIQSFKKYMELENVIAVDDINSKALPIEVVENGKIAFNNVSFKYPLSDKYVLKNINLEIDPSKFYVIVGKNGAGKTTFTNLLMRLYDPTNGYISLNSEDIKQYKYQDYRDCFGVVFQNYKVFDYSLIENVTLNADNDDISTQKARDALYSAGLSEKIGSLKEGINTYIGKAFNEFGIQLSGGEYQKVALAKALYRDSAILILDEPSSALDAFAEDDLITTFKKASESKTVFYISHRLSVARYAYKVIFINGNEIAGFDTHENLLVNCPEYKEMYVAQAKHYTDEFER